MGQWSYLPVDLLAAIGECLLLYVDKLRFSSVCASWRSALPNLPNMKHRQLPWLLLPYNDTTETYCGFFNLLDGTVYHVELPEARGTLFRGSSHGWLITVENSPAISLINPLTRVRVHLPPVSTFPSLEDYAPRSISSRVVRNRFKPKIVLSSCPTSGDYVAVVIYGYEQYYMLAYCNCGDKKWTFLEECSIQYRDVVFHEGRLYALDETGRMAVFEFCPNPEWYERKVNLENGCRIKTHISSLISALFKHCRTCINELFVL